VWRVVRASIAELRLVGGDVGRDIEVAQVVDAVSVVGAESVGRRDPGEWCATIVMAATRSMVLVAERSAA
jgi:hypothetical protein